MIIIEGPDNSGKSTLGEYLSRDLALPLHHFGGPPSTKAEAIRRMEFVLSNANNYIFDRIPLISEEVYCSLRGDKNLLEGEDYFRDQLLALKPIILYCSTNNSFEGHVVKEHDTVEHIEALKKKRELILHKYNEVILEYPHIVWDYKESNYDTLLNIIEHILTTERNRMP